MSKWRVGNIANDVILWSQTRWCRIMAAKKLRVTFLSNCICEKGRYFVPMVRYTNPYISFFVSVLEIATLWLIL